MERRIERLPLAGIVVLQKLETRRLECGPVFRRQLARRLGGQHNRRTSLLVETEEIGDPGAAFGDGVALETFSGGYVGCDVTGERRIPVAGGFLDLGFKRFSNRSLHTGSFVGGHR
jgi:hypothetical protein